LVLGADEHALEGHRDAVFVLERDLGLAVGTQVGDLPGLADLGQALCQAVRRPDRQRHQVGRLVAGVPEHHALVAGALRLDAVLTGLAGTDLFTDVDALGDVGALLVDRDDDATGVAVEAVEGVVVADGVDRLAGDLRDLDVGVGGDLAGDDTEAGRQQRLAGDAPVGILGEDGVEHGVGDLVGHLVGMALGDALRGEGVHGHGDSVRCPVRVEYGGRRSRR
jgi:hypothetical protein